MENVFHLVEEAAKSGADLIVTTEAVNYFGHFSKIKTNYSDLYQEMEQTQKNEALKKLMLVCRKMRSLVLLRLQRPIM